MIHVILLSTDHQDPYFDIYFKKKFLFEILSKVKVPFFFWVLTSAKIFIKKFKFNNVYHIELNDISSSQQNLLSIT